MLSYTRWADYELAFTLSWLFRTGAVFLLPAILHLCLVLPGKRVPTRWAVVLGFDYGLAGLLAVLNMFGLLVARLATFEWGYHSIGTKYYNLFPVLAVVNSMLSVSVLVREYRTTSEPRMRLQLKFWLLGLALALPLGLTNLLPSYGVPFYPLGNLGSAAWAGIVGYAIVRYRLMDIELVVTRALGFLSATVVVVLPVFLLTLSLQSPRIRRGPLRFFRRARGALDCRGRRVLEIAGIHRDAIGADVVSGEGGKPNQACCLGWTNGPCAGSGSPAGFVVRVVVRGVRSRWALLICSR